MTIGERIKEVRKSNNLTQADFGKQVKISGASVSMIEKGINNPSDRTISLICREFGVREEWLRTGDGSMKEEKPPDVALAAELDKVITAGSEDFRKRLIAWLVRMPPERWKALEEIALELLRDVSNVSAPAPQPAAPSREEQVEAEAEEVKRRIIESNLPKGGKASESGKRRTGSGTA